jgi:hypothetical protein
MLSLTCTCVKLDSVGDYENQAFKKYTSIHQSPTILVGYAHPSTSGKISRYAKGSDSNSEFFTFTWCQSVTSEIPLLNL